MNATPGSIPLKARTVTDLLDAAVGLYRHNFGTLLGVVAVVHAPLLGLQVIGGGLWAWGMSQGTSDNLPGWAMAVAGMAGMAILGVYYLGALVLAPLSAGAVALAVSDLYLGRTVTIREAYRRAAPWWLQLFLAQLIIQFGMGMAVVVVGVPLLFAGGFAAVSSPALGIGLMIAGGLIMLVLMLAGFLLLLAAIPAIVVERRNAIDAIGRSFRLVRPGWKRALAAYALLGLLVALPMMLAYGLTIASQAASASDMQSFPLTNALVGALVSLVTLLVMPITMGGQVVIYYDLRVRQEGFDLEVMAANLGLKASAAARDLPPPALLLQPVAPPPPPLPPPPPADITAKEELNQ